MPPFILVAKKHFHARFHFVRNLKCINSRIHLFSFIYMLLAACTITTHTHFIFHCFPPKKANHQSLSHCRWSSYFPFTHSFVHLWVPFVNRSRLLVIRLVDRVCRLPINVGILVFGANGASLSWFHFNLIGRTPKTTKLVFSWSVSVCYPLRFTI